MPIGLGLAASHAPNVFIAPEDWDTRYKAAIDDVPQPLRAKEETLEVRRAYAQRIESSFTTLRHSRCRNRYTPTMSSVCQGRSVSSGPMAISYSRNVSAP